MRVDQAFKKSGFEILAANKDNGTLVFDVRIPIDGKIPARWKNLLADILPLSEHNAKQTVPKWTIDISKRFYSRDGVVRYLWRVVIHGNLAVCQAALVTATLNALRTGNELTEVPLIGQMTVMPDPKNGRFKGAYPKTEGDDLAMRAISGAFTSGG